MKGSFFNDLLKYISLQVRSLVTCRYVIRQLLMEFDASQSVGHCVLVPKQQDVHDRRKSSEKLWQLDVHVVCCTSIYYFV